MKLAYWQRGQAQPLKTHIVRQDERPACGHRHATDATAHWFPGSLAAVECHNCLRCHRAELRRELATVAQRLAGKGGIQRDAFA